MKPETYKDGITLIDKLRNPPIVGVIVFINNKPTFIEKK
jgi:hypothetical protein